MAGWDQLTREQLLVVVAEQATLIQTLTEQVQALTAQVAELTRLLGQNSGNSSLPPSTDRGRGPSRPRPGLESEARQAARRARLHAGDRHRPGRGDRPPARRVRRLRSRSG